VSYRQALVASGAHVIDFATFGTWQGDWLAFVEYNGERGVIRGYFGSCVACDAFENEFGYSWEDYADDIEKRLAQFGAAYMDNIRSVADVRANFERDSEWDDDAQRAIAWLDGLEK
jgi:hypothetical protein